MTRFRNYWAYSIGLAVAWAVVLTLALAIRGATGVQVFLLIVRGLLHRVGSTTIARYAYPPPKRWGSNQA